MQHPAAGTDQTPQRIRSMFESVSPSYDGLNRLFSGWLDQYWRGRAAAELTRGLEPCARVLDVATGTGDLARAVRRRTGARVIGLDFTRPMLERALAKFGPEGHAWIEGDGLKLPFAAGAFDACCVAFGLRNMVDRDAALAEMRRVVRPGGSVGVLEFSSPNNAAFSKLYDLYSYTVMPRVGRFVSRSDAYLYLADSIRDFWSPGELEDHMTEAGFSEVRQVLFMNGAVRLHLARVDTEAASPFEANRQEVRAHAN